MPKSVSHGSAIDRAVATKQVGQIVLSQKLLEGLLGIDAGDIVAIQQEDHERQAGIFRIFVWSDRLNPVGDGKVTPMIQLADVQ